MARGISAEAREDILVQAFLTCPNISEISKKTKIPRPTIYTVIHTDSFQRKYSEARNEAVTGAIAYLQGKLGECAAVLYCYRSIFQVVRIIRNANISGLLSTGIFAFFI